MASFSLNPTFYFFVSEYQLVLISHYFHPELLEEPSADLHIFWYASEAISAFVSIPVAMTFYTIYIYLYALVIMTVPTYVLPLWKTKAFK